MLAVTNDVPDNAVVVGAPGRVISPNGSTDYVMNTDDGQSDIQGKSGRGA